MAKRTYTVPDEVAGPFDTAVPPGDRSRVVTRLMQEYLDEQRRQRTREAIVEGCREMGEIYLETAAEWNAVDEETWRVL
jgi:metal-responsive CopG/Arc/MetJ family transcriptional regulator